MCRILSAIIADGQRTGLTILMSMDVTAFITGTLFQSAKKGALDTNRYQAGQERKRKNDGNVTGIDSKRT